MTIPILEFESHQKTKHRLFFGRYDTYTTLLGGAQRGVAHTKIPMERSATYKNSFGLLSYFCRVSASPTAHTEFSRQNALNNSTVRQCLSQRYGSWGI
jgi:hypothetical protein